MYSMVAVAASVLASTCGSALYYSHPMIILILFLGPPQFLEYVVGD